MFSSFLSKNIFLARILPFLALGITVAFSFPLDLLTSCLILLLIAFIIFVFTKEGIFVSIFFTLLGFFITQDKLNTHTIKPNNEENIYSATIISTIKEGEKFKTFQIETDKGFRANIFKKQDSIKYLRGDRLLVAATFKRIENYSDFDYKRYMRTLYCEYYAYSDGLVVLSHNSFKNPILKYSNILHNKLKDRIKNSSLEDENASFLTALLIGERKGISSDLKQKYINVGLIHILAISGLHIGIIFLIIRLFLLKVLRIRERSLAFLLISLLSLWIYAFICFMPSSVFRACMIISLVLIAKFSKRKPCIYNLIGATAFIILLIDPAALFRAGFQLSFSAYTSIIYFYPKIKNLWKPQKMFNLKIWEIFCISLSAQIGTNPLVALHFGQIANYSIISNLLITFFIPVIIYSSLLWLIIPINILTQFLNTLIATINSIISLLSKLPHTLTYTNMNITETILIYCFILSTFCMIWYKKKKLIWLSLSSIILFNLLISIESLMG
jgi:competence protein ComEC